MIQLVIIYIWELQIYLCQCKNLSKSASHAPRHCVTVNLSTAFCHEMTSTCKSINGNDNSVPLRMTSWVRDDMHAPRHCVTVNLSTTFCHEMTSICKSINENDNSVPLRMTSWVRDDMHASASLGLWLTEGSKPLNWIEEVVGSMLSIPRS